MARALSGIKGSVMPRRTYNAVVEYTLATTAEEIAEIFERLSKDVASGLASEIEIAGDARRFDAHAKRCLLL